MRTPPTPEVLNRRVGITEDNPVLYEIRRTIMQTPLISEGCGSVARNAY